jgi:hypothetical protein
MIERNCRAAGLHAFWLARQALTAASSARMRDCNSIHFAKMSAAVIADANVHYQQVRDTWAACAHPTDAERRIFTASRSAHSHHDMWCVYVLAVCDTLRSSIRI